MFEIYSNVVWFGLDHGLVQISEGGKRKFSSQWRNWWGYDFLVDDARGKFDDLVYGWNLF